MPKNNPVYIPTVEAKDLYNSNNLCYDNPNGYSIRARDGTINIHKFVNTLDYSLDLIKLREIYEKIYRRHDFSFKINHKEYSNQVINVKFSYAMKVFNKAAKNIYIRNGYQLRDITLENHICVIDNTLVAIEVNTDVEVPYPNLSIFENYFVYEDKQYKPSGTLIKTIMTEADLRQYLYKHGFMCDGVKYIRWKRSSGSSRVGKCLFINEALYNRMHKWETCGLRICDGDEIDLAAFEAVISLTSSSIIDTIEIKPENFLIIKDYDSVFKDTVIGVGFENGHLTAQTTQVEITNSIFDGQSLIDKSLIPDEYQRYGMLLLRNRMFKSASFNTNIQQWFADNNITAVEQLNGFTLATDINDIKIITTPNSIKYSKFGKIEDWLRLVEPTFGIVKYEKPPHYFDGRKVRCHYQLINTLQLSEEDVHTLIQPSLDYISQVRNDPDILRYHINYPYNETAPAPLHSKNEIIFKLLGLNSDFCKTKLYYDFRDDLVKSMIRDLKQGHILINGNYSTLLGNGIEMLQESIGSFKGESVIGKGNIHCKRFAYGKTILGSRSPHICAGNVLLVQNISNETIDKYFNLTEEIVYINSIEENILQRLNGADFDSDTILLTDEALLIDTAKQNYERFKVPTCCVTAQKIKRYYTTEQQADLDIKISVNKIGEIVNLSQMLNSIFWQNICNGQNIEDNQELYDDICKLAVLSNLEIDRAKREYAVSSSAELRYIKDKYKDKDKGKTVKPMFFKTIAYENGYRLNTGMVYKYFKTPMDYLQKYVSRFNFHNHRHSKKNIIPFSYIVKDIESKNISSTYYNQRDRIINIVSDTNNKIKALYCNYADKTIEERDIIKKQSADIKSECAEYINDLTISENTMYLLLRTLDNKEYKHLQKRIFETLFGTPNKTFFKMIIDNRGQINKLTESEEGTITLYDLKYIKEAVN